MDAPSIQSLTVVSRPYWTVRVSREETLVIREKFRKVGWRPPNHKPKTTKVVTWAKSLWDSYVTRGYLLQCGTCVDRVISDIVNTLVLTRQPMDSLTGTRVP
jgi:hypothetical protein